MLSEKFNKTSENFVGIFPTERFSIDQPEILSVAVRPSSGGTQSDLVTIWFSDWSHINLLVFSDQKEADLNAKIETLEAKTTSVGLENQELRGQIEELAADNKDLVRRLTQIADILNE